MKVFTICAVLFLGFVPATGMTEADFFKLRPGDKVKFTKNGLKCARWCLGIKKNTIGVVTNTTKQTWPGQNFVYLRLNIVDPVPVRGEDLVCVYVFASNINFPY